MASRYEKKPFRTQKQVLFARYDSTMSTRKSSAFVLSSVFAVLLCWPLVAYSDTPPCNLLTQSQVSTVVGASVGAAAPIANTGCSWTAAGPPRVTVSVSMQSEKRFDAAKSSIPQNMTRAQVSGVGDEAIFLGAQGFSSLWVRKGQKCLLVRVYGLPVSEAQTKLKTLATNAVSKL